MKPPWFVYRRSTGRLTAWPCSAAGWAALLTIVAAMLGACLAILQRLAPMGVWVAIIGQLLVMTLGFAALFWLVVTRGRRID